MNAVTRSWSTSNFCLSMIWPTSTPKRTARNAWSSNSSSGNIFLSKVFGLAPNCWAKRCSIRLRWRSISAASMAFGTSNSFLSTKASCLTWLRAAFLISRSMFLRTSVFSLSRPPSVTPNNSKNSSLSSGSLASLTSFKVILKSASLPFKFSAW